MKWDKTLRLLAWACFCLMWIPLAIFIVHDTSLPHTDELPATIAAFIVLLFMYVILLPVSFLGPLAVGWFESRCVRRQGILVPATIRDLADTGIYINSQPVLEIRLSVQPPHEAAFDATVQKTIPFSAIPQVQPGSQVDVYYIPGTTRVALPE
jgi:hypothetical protein